jgi:hypothetical protein
MSSSVRRAIAAARIRVLNAPRTSRSIRARHLVALGAVALATVLPIAPTMAQAPADPYADRFSLVGGVSQLLLGGANVEGTWYTSRFSLAYSHGVNLQLGGGLLPTAAQDQQLQASMSWTTGAGLGYRVTSTFDVRLEVKQHRFALRYDDQDFRGPTIAEYTTTTVGVGAYYRYYPFARRTGAARGLVIVPSVRYWPNVASSLDDNTLVYPNARTGRVERHQALTQGVPGTGGLLANVSVGYTFRVGLPR